MASVRLVSTGNCHMAPKPKLSAREPTASALRGFLPTVHRGVLQGVSRVASLRLLSVVGCGVAPGPDFARICAAHPYLRIRTAPESDAETDTC